MITLKEVFLLQEREDLLFVASEIVKHYRLKSKVKFGTYGGDQGGYNWDTDTIMLNKYYPKVSEFIIKGSKKNPTLFFSEKITH